MRCLGRWEAYIFPWILRCVWRVVARQNVTSCMDRIRNAIHDYVNWKCIMKVVTLPKLSMIDLICLFVRYVRRQIVLRLYRDGYSEFKVERPKVRSLKCILFNIRKWMKMADCAENVCVCECLGHVFRSERGKYGCVCARL